MKNIRSAHGVFIPLRRFKHPSGHTRVPAVLRRVLLPAAEGLHRAAGLERPQEQAAAVLPDPQDCGRKGARRAGVQVSGDN